MERLTTFRFKSEGGGHKRQRDLLKLMNTNDFGYAGSYAVYSSRTHTKVADFISGRGYCYYIIQKEDKNQSAIEESERFKNLLDKF